MPCNSLIDHADEIFLFFFLVARCAGHQGSQRRPWFELIANRVPTHTLFQSRFRSFPVATIQRKAVLLQFYLADLAVHFSYQMKCIAPTPPQVWCQDLRCPSNLQERRKTRHNQEHVCKKVEVSTTAAMPPFNI